MKKLIIVPLLLPLVSNALVFNTDPVDPRVTHCALYQDGAKIQTDPLFVGETGNICHFDVSLETVPLGLHGYTVTVQVSDINGKITAESNKSNRVWYNNRPPAPTGLKVTQ